MSQAGPTEDRAEDRTRTGLRILVPLDDSSQSERALPYAESLARATHGYLRLIRTTPSNTPTDYIERALERIARRVHQAGVPADWRVVEGAATPAILEVARSWPADIIALATTKWSGVDRWLNASVADAVVRSADRPVLVVPPEWQPPAARHQPKHILVPLDGSPLAEQALVLAARLAAPLGADLILLRVIDAAQDQGRPPDRSSAGAGGAEAYVQRWEAPQFSAPGCSRGTCWCQSTSSTT
jgi:nucleotide-binding universal stress UspA family protein